MDNQIGVTYTGDNTARMIEAGSTSEAIAGAGAVVLGILGLIGVYPNTLDAIACIAAGAGLLMAGGAIAGRFSRLTNAVEPSQPRQEVTGSLGMEALAGAAGVVLGILALLGIGTISLLAVAAIVLGAGLIMAGGARSRLESMSRFHVTGESRAMQDVVYVSSGSDILVGVGVIVLGILALSGIAPLTLTLVSMLAVGAAILLGGSTIAARAFRNFG